MGTCSLENCDNTCFEQEDKCILHCEKDDWYEIKDIKKDWSKSTEKVKLFWETINKEIEGVNSAIMGSKNKGSYELKKVIFPESIYEDNDFFQNLDKEANIDFKECKFLGFTDFSLISNAKDVYFTDNCIFFEYTEFMNNEFDGFFIFEGCKVHKNIRFQNIVFNNTTSFIDSNFFQNLIFIHTRFEGLALFNQVKVNRLLLDNTFFSLESNFLNINAGMSNRETARIIKNSFEQQSNIIEANKFYALEMKEREKELTRDIKNKEKRDLKTFIDYIIFKLHGISSNHSQDPVLPVLWILNIAFIFSMFTSTFHHNNMLAYISIFTVIALLIFNNTLLKRVLGINLIIFYGLSYIKLDDIADKINPFSIMTSKDPIPFGLLIFKITIAYLIYQFIVSVRQNTRRK